MTTTRDRIASRIGTADETITGTIADGLDALTDGRGWDAGHERAMRLANAAPVLLKEVETMLSRVEAILAVDEAVVGLTRYDVFGAGYDDLLRADADALRKAIDIAKGVRL